MAKTDKVQRGITPPPQDFHARIDQLRAELDDFIDAHVDRLAAETPGLPKLTAVNVTCF
jgi:hypothetical protein